ncbi:tripartite tricarboxylate transporter substrate binding protein [Pigmentiphaga soli]|uniref:Tripartite tricarboxylate transporter substrate binding protein n=1 Tax=Pigmentiphaga soli TaxID=1007095 RepID=A0ABP8GY16_9BURK
MHIVAKLSLLCPALAATACIATARAADAYPSRPLRLVVGYAAGGGADTAARVVAQALGNDLGQAAVVENKPGGSGVIAVGSVAKAPADGYTLLVISAGELVQPLLRDDLSYDFQKDLVPVAFLGISPFVLVVHPAVPARTVAELVAYGKSAPGKLNFGSSGVGTSPHLAGELFSMMSGTPMAHIPYKGGAQAANATMSGEIQVSFPAATSALPLVQAGKVRALAVTTLQRTAFMPELPTLDELGLKGFHRSSWYAVMAPAGTPPATIATLNEAVNRVLKDAGVRRALEGQGIEPGGGSAAALGDMIRTEMKQNEQIIEKAGLKKAS